MYFTRPMRIKSLKRGVVQQTNVCRRLQSTYQPRTLPLSIKKLLVSDSGKDSSSVIVSGWIKSIRCQKSVSFAMITDGSTPTPLQAVFKTTDLVKRCGARDVHSLRSE